MGIKPVVSERVSPRWEPCRGRSIGSKESGTYLLPEGVLDVLSQACHQQGQETGEVDGWCHGVGHSAVGESAGSRKLC